MKIESLHFIYTEFFRRDNKLKILKRTSIIFVVFLIAVSITQKLYANETNIIKNEYLEVCIDTDKIEYSNNEKIKVVLTVKNISTTDVNGIELENIIPEEMQLEGNQETILKHDVLSPGESVKLENVILKSTALNTGDDINYVIYIILIIFSLLIGFCVDKHSKKIAVIGLCVFMIVPNIGVISAQEKDEVSVKKNIKVGNNSIVLEGKVNYDKVIVNIDDSITLEINKDNLFLTEDDVYMFKDNNMSLSGILDPIDKITSFKFYVSNDIGNIIDEGDININNNWSIADLGMFIGLNKIVVIANSASGMKKVEMTIYNDDADKLLNTNIDTTVDSDNDGVADYIEDYFGSDKNEIDTDNDGLNDNIEHLIPGCDASKDDTNQNGILDGDEDYDGDGLTNKEEIDLSLDPATIDTDGDGLNDYKEINEHKTNPQKSDTDDDGANDKWEIDNSYDPLLKNDSFTIEKEAETLYNNVYVSAKVAGNAVENLEISKANNQLLLNTSIPGSMSDPIELSLDGDLISANLSIEFDDSYLNSDVDPVIYYFDEVNQKLVPQDTKVENNIATCSLSHFSTYILLNSKEFDEIWNTEIKPPEYTGEDQKHGLDVVLAIDSSGSMSSNDRNGLRKEAANLFVDKLGENDRAAVIDFDSWSHTLTGLTNDKETIKTAINSIDSNGGTNLSNPVSASIDLLTNDYQSKNKYKFIILLTDGQGSYNHSYSQTALDNDIQIYTIGLGGGVDANLLKRIADDTKGNYYFASNADELLGIYEITAGETIDYVTDTNKDGISDYYTKLMCEGELRLGTGTSIFEGVSFEKVQANADFDNDGLLNGDEVIVKQSDDNKIVVKMISDPTSSNIDLDNFIDRVDINLGNSPFKYNVYQNDIDILGETENMATLFSEKFDNDGWYKFQLGLGNYLYGGEYNWTYVCEKELLDFVNIYANSKVKKNDEKSQAEVYLYNVKEQMEVLKSWYNILRKLSELGESTVLKELTILIEEYYSYIEMISTSISENSINIEYISELYYEYTIKIEAIYEKVSGIIDISKYPKILESANKLKSIMNKVPESFGKISKGIKYVSVAIDSVKALKNTVESYSKLQTNASVFNDIKELIEQIKARTDNSHMKKACDNILDNLEQGYVDFGTKVNDLINNGSLDVAIDGILDSTGPIGWAVSLGRDLANLISGVGETTAGHLHMIAIGDAIRCYQPYLREIFISSNSDPYTDNKDIALQRMALIGQLQIIGHNKVYKMSDSQSWLIKIFNKHDDVKDLCKTSLEMIEGVGDRYHLLIDRNYNGAVI